MQEHDPLRTGVDQEIPFSQSTDEYFAQEFAGPVLLSVKGPLKARIEVHADFKLLMTFLPFQETGPYFEIQCLIIVLEGRN